MNLRKWCGLTAALLCLVLALTACSGTPTESTVSAPTTPTTPTTTPTTAAPTPADLYAAAAAADQKMSDLNSLDFTADITVEIQGGDTSVSTKIAMDLVTVKNDETGIDFALNMKTSAMGQTAEQKMWYKGGFLYMDAQGQKIAMPVSLEQAAEAVKLSSTLELSEDMFKNATVTEENGLRTIRTTFDGAALKQWLADSGLENIANIGDDTELTFGTSELIVTVNEQGYMTSEVLKLPMAVKVGAQEIAMTLTEDITFNNPGQEVTVNWPDFSGFTVTDLGDMEG